MQNLNVRRIMGGQIFLNVADNLVYFSTFRNEQLIFSLTCFHHLKLNDLFSKSSK